MNHFKTCSTFFVPILALQLLACPIASAKSALLEEILVTAQKREQSAQDVPIALTAVSGEALIASNVNSSEDLTLITPGLQYNRAVSSSTPYIRGVGSQDTSMGNESSVASYVDGFYLRTMVGASQAFNNIERVEVLKGPQGTLFGRNSTGGVIQVITKTPSHDTESILELGLASHETTSATYYGTTSLSDKVAGSINVGVQRQGKGTGVNRTLNTEVGFDEYLHLSSKLLITPTDDTDITLTFMYDEKENDIGLLRTCVIGAACLGYVPDADFEDTFDDFLPFTEHEGLLAGMHIKHSFDNIDLVSITSYQESESFTSIDQDTGPLPIVDINFSEFTETFGQEFQLLSTYDSQLNWIVGLFYWKDKGRYDPVHLRGLGVENGAIDLFMNNETETESISVFGQFDYSLSDKTTATIGVRWTQDERTIAGINTINLRNTDFTIMQIPYGDTNKEDELSWRLSLSHNVSDDVMVYVAHNRGFKSGVFNGLVTTGVLEPALEPEILDTYTIGMKGDFLDDRLRINAEIYKYDFENMQLRRVENGADTKLLNAAEADILGLDLSITALITDTLSASLGYSAIDGEYKDFPDCVIWTPNAPFPGNSPSAGDCSGNTTILTPDQTVSLILNHSLPTDMGTFDTALSLYHSDSFFSNPENRLTHPSYEVVNLTTSWTSTDEKYTVSLYGKNIFEEDYSSYILSSQLSDNTAVGIYPREFGMKFKIHF